MWYGSRFYYDRPYIICSMLCLISDLWTNWISVYKFLPKYFEIPLMAVNSSKSWGCNIKVYLIQVFIKVNTLIAFKNLIAYAIALFSPFLKNHLYSRFSIPEFHEPCKQIQVKAQQWH